MCKINFACKSCILLNLQRYCMALEQWLSAKLCSVVSSRDRAAIPFDTWQCNYVVLSLSTTEFLIEGGVARFTLTFGHQYTIAIINIIQ